MDTQLSLSNPLNQTNEMGYSANLRTTNIMIQENIYILTISGEKAFLYEKVRKNDFVSSYSQSCQFKMVTLITNSI